MPAIQADRREPFQLAQCLENVQRAGEVGDHDGLLAVVAVEREQQAHRGGQLACERQKRKAHRHHHESLSFRWMHLPADVSCAPYQTALWPIAGLPVDQRPGCTWPASAAAAVVPACPADPHWRGRPRPRPRPRPRARRCSALARSDVCNSAGDISRPLSCRRWRHWTGPLPWAASATTPTGSCTVAATAGWPSAAGAAGPLEGPTPARIAVPMSQWRRCTAPAGVWWAGKRGRRPLSSHNHARQSWDVVRRCRRMTTNGRDWASYSWVAGTGWPRRSCGAEWTPWWGGTAAGAHAQHHNEVVQSALTGYDDTWIPGAVHTSSERAWPMATSAGLLDGWRDAAMGSSNTFRKVA